MLAWFTAVCYGIAQTVVRVTFFVLFSERCDDTPCPVCEIAMAHPNVSDASDSAQDAVEAAASATSIKAAWEEPRLTRMDISLTQTQFATVPDGDTAS